MRHFETREFAHFTLCETKRNVTSAQYFTAFIKDKRWIKILCHFCVVLKTYPIETNSVCFHEQIYEKYTVHVCLVPKKTCVPLWLWRRWGQKFGQFMPFPPKETFTILSTICAPLNCLKAEIFIDYAP